MLHAGYLGGITTLLKAGASINLQNKRGHTPLFVAVTGGHFFCVQHLIKVSATVRPQPAVYLLRCHLRAADLKHGA